METITTNLKSMYYVDKEMQYIMKKILSNKKKFQFSLRI